MSNLPIALINPYYIGDSVLLTGIAESLYREYGNKIYVLSKYPELFENHPFIIGLDWQSKDMPKDVTLIDLTQSIASTEKKAIDGESKLVMLPNKLSRMYTQAMTTQRYEPRLYLSDNEIEQANEIRKLYGGRRIGIIPSSRSPVKNWEYYSLLIERLCLSYNVFVFGEKRFDCEQFAEYPIKFVTDKSLR